MELKSNASLCFDEGQEQVAQRVNEAQKLGFKRCILPKNNLKSREGLKTSHIELIGVETVKQALDCL